MKTLNAQKSAFEALSDSTRLRMVRVLALSGVPICQCELVDILMTSPANISPGIANWIGTSSGTRGLGLNYAVTDKYGQAELYIDRGKDCDEENKRIFDELQSHRAEIEKDYGCMSSATFGHLTRI